jgi:DNA repair protein RecN (Recombination protein N)
MIKRLSVKNYALIETLEINFSKGLTIITGETGAGKSILLGALGLIMGKRADTKSLYNEEEKCIVEAVYDISHNKLNVFFEENDLDYATEVLVRRELLPNGKSRAFINDTPVNLNILTELSEALIDLHQQFDTLDIHKISFQLRMLDALANNQKSLEEYFEVYKKWSADKKQLDQLKQKSLQSQKDRDFIDFQLNELKEAMLKEGESAFLETELSRLSHAQEIKSTLGGAFQALSENDNSVTTIMSDISNRLSHLSRFDEHVKNMAERMDSLRIELDDLTNEIENYGERIELDPEGLEKVKSRLDFLYRLQKKHQVPSETELIALLHQLEIDSQGFENLSAEIEVLETAVSETEHWLTQIAFQLREKRIAAIPQFETKVMEKLHAMAMEHAVLKIDLTHKTDLDLTGLDEVNFMFAANKGSRLQLIKDVASGGELSRLTLAVKSLVASSIPLPTLIFDEIDSGISGDIALKMGIILRNLSDQHQVVTITHSPQVASRADSHYFVYKDPSGERTLTKVKELTQEERIRELAIMLSQNPPSASAIENAKELMNLN